MLKTNTLVNEGSTLYPTVLLRPHSAPRKTSVGESSTTAFPLLFSSHPVLNLNQADTTRVYVCANRCVGTTKLSRFVWENKSEVWESGRCWMGQGKQKEEEEEAPIPHQSQSLFLSPQALFPCLQRSERRGGKTDPSPFSRPNNFPFSPTGKRRRRTRRGNREERVKVFLFLTARGGNDMFEKRWDSHLRLLGRLSP